MKLPVPASFNEKQVNVTTKLGSSVSLTCNAIGDEPMMIKWSRSSTLINPQSINDQLVHDPRKKYTLQTVNNSTSKLVINQVTRSDSTFLSCEARNQFGSAIKTFVIKVQEPPEVINKIEIEYKTSRTVSLKWIIPFDGEMITN